MSEKQKTADVLDLSSKRKAIPRKTRFEVFKRDSFTCQYCGAKAPDAVLVVDHVDPVSRGGDNSILNLVTSCQPCNAGKGAVPLSDQAALAYCREHDALKLIEDAYLAGYDFETLKRVVRENTCWTAWRDSMYRLVDGDET